MEEIIFKEKKNKDRFNYFLHKYGGELKENQYNLMKIVIINYKRYVRDEKNLIFVLIYGFDFFLSICETDKEIKDKEINMVKKFKKILSHDLNLDIENLITELENLNHDMFTLKMVIKYTIISFDAKFLDFIKNRKNYFLSIGYTIPLLTKRNSCFLRFFQDTFFENIYPKQYKETKKIYLNKINQIAFPGEHMVAVVNGLNKILNESGIFGRIQIRKKSYFSLYNKIQRKESENILDAIGVRIIFEKKEDIYNFIEIFEHRYIFIKKKDFIIMPKKNGYQSIHYTFLSPYRDMEVIGELQIRTSEMDDNIKKDMGLSHYNYTLVNNKWSEKFKEIHKGANILNSLIKKHN